MSFCFRVRKKAGLRRPISPPPRPEAKLSATLVATPAPNVDRKAAAHTDPVTPAIREAQAAGAKSLDKWPPRFNGRGVTTPRAGKREAATVGNNLK
jgi:hypothetical protein